LVEGEGIIIAIILFFKGKIAFVVILLELLSKNPIKKKNDALNS